MEGPAQWARLAVTAYHEFRADRIVAERNFGGAMVENVITTAGPNVPDGQRYCCAMW
jgi:phage terminase large subunit-like protein